MSTQSNARFAKKSTRRTYRSPTSLTCAGCRGEIEPGTKFWRGLTKEPWHPSCKRTGVVPGPAPIRRYPVDDPIGKHCGGCRLEILAGEAFVHLRAAPWHKFCALGR